MILNLWTRRLRVLWQTTRTWIGEDRLDFGKKLRADIRCAFQAHLGFRAEAERKQGHDHGRGEPVFYVVLCHGMQTLHCNKMPCQQM